jgi:hypothetical protein
VDGNDPATPTTGSGFGKSRLFRERSTPANPAAFIFVGVRTTPDQAFIGAAAHIRGAKLA